MRGLFVAREKEGGKNKKGRKRRGEGGRGER